MASFTKDPTHYAHPLFQSNELPKPIAKKNKAPNKKLPTWMTHTVKQGYTSYLVHTNATTLEPKDYRPPRIVGGFEPTGEQFETNESFTIEEMSQSQRDSAKVFLHEFDTIKKNIEMKPPPVNKWKDIGIVKEKPRKGAKEEPQLKWVKDIQRIIARLKKFEKSDKGSSFNSELHGNVIKAIDSDIYNELMKPDKQEDGKNSANLKKSGEDSSPARKQLEACGKRGKQLIAYLLNYDLMSRKWNKTLKDTDKIIENHEAYVKTTNERMEGYTKGDKSSKERIDDLVHSRDKMENKKKKKNGNDKDNEGGK